jgi:hypothetical protein
VDQLAQPGLRFGHRIRTLQASRTPTWSLSSGRSGATSTVPVVTDTRSSSRWSVAASGAEGTCRPNCRVEKVHPTPNGHCFAPDGVLDPDRVSDDTLAECLARLLLLYRAGRLAKHSDELACPLGCHKRISPKGRASRARISRRSSPALVPLRPR